MSTVSEPMPSIFIPHGGGPAFFMNGPMEQMFRPMARFLAEFDATLPRRPTAILVVTAHWEAPTVTLTGGPSPELIYDYYGFPPETYHLTYPATGLPTLAETASGLLTAAGVRSQVDAAYGWDHGVFIPLKVMYPKADVPVVAMSLQAGLDPATHTKIGEALRPLREQGVLIVGSGLSYHNLGRFMAGAPESAGFHDWLDRALDGDAKHRADQLNRWAGAPSARLSHPREEHLIPLMVASGAGSDAPATKVWSGEVNGTVVGAWSFS
jgi:aromatic ring-opening dioxygenase catalytic subunit (LigB family)